jgi:prepilin-type N-terminal cleavage/methylation domain-containing protein
MKNHSERGVTLIEILIAVSLLSLLSVGMLVAMRLGFNTMDKTDARLVRNRRVSNSRKIIESELNGFISLMAFYHPRPGEMSPVPFFESEPESMRFITSYSLEGAWRGSLQIAAMQVIPGERNQGVRLILNETSYAGPEQTGQLILRLEQDGLGNQLARFGPILPGPQSFVLADRLEFCRFSYLEPRFEAPFQIWRHDWVQPRLLPLAIRIEMAPLNPGNPTELQIGTVTVPLNVNGASGVSYADFVPTPQE